MKKIILILVSFVLLVGCVQSFALLGPAITGASTGKVYHAGLSYGSNMLMEKVMKIISKDLTIKWKFLDPLNVLINHQLLM